MEKLSASENPETESLFFRPPPVIFSSAAGQLEQEIHFLVPKSRPDASNCPVLYLTDADQYLGLAETILSELVRAQKIPPVLLAGFFHKKRSYELTPERKSKANEIPIPFGGAEYLSDFLSGPLAAYICDTFSAANFSVFFGHSFGGIFGFYHFCRFPAFFDAALVLSPTIWWNEGEFIFNFCKKLKNKEPALKQLYLCLASESPHFQDFVLSAVKEIEQANRLKNLDFQFTHFTSESHMSMVEPGLKAGLEFVFRDYAENRRELAEAKNISEFNRTADARQAIFKLHPEAEEYVSGVENSFRNRDFCSGEMLLSEGLFFYPENPELQRLKTGGR